MDSLQYLGVLFNVLVQGMQEVLVYEVVKLSEIDVEDVRRGSSGHRHQQAGLPGSALDLQPAGADDVDLGMQFLEAFEDRTLGTPPGIGCVFSRDSPVAAPETQGYGFIVAAVVGRSAGCGNESGGDEAQREQYERSQNI